MSDNNKTNITVCVTAKYNNETGKFSEENVDITVGDKQPVKKVEDAVEIIGKLRAPANPVADNVNATATATANPDANANATNSGAVKDGAQDKSDAKKPATATANPDANANATNSGAVKDGAQDKSGAVKDGAQDKSDANTVAGDLPKNGDKFTMTKGSFANQIGTVEEVNEETKTVKLKFDNGETINPTYDALQKISQKANNTSGGGRSKAKRRRPKRVGTKKKKHTKRQRKYGSKTKKY